MNMSPNLVLNVRASGVISVENYGPRRVVLIEITEKMNHLRQWCWGGNGG